MFDRGQVNDSLYRVLMANVRGPQFLSGDIEAAITGNAIGISRINKLLRDLQLKDLRWLGDEILARSEQAMRNAIGSLANGVYRAAVDFDPLDPDGDPLHVQVEVTVRDGEVTVDYAGTCDQVHQAINSTLSYTTAYSQFGVRLTVTDSIPNNAGSFAPIKVVAPEGSLVASRHPAPTNSRSAIGQNIPQLVIRALAQADPPFLVADNAGGSVGIRFVPDIGSISNQVRVSSGTGARKDRDGLIATAFPARVRRQSVETIEQEGYFQFLRQERRRGSGGAGRYNGGDGMVAEVQLVGCDGVVDFSLERSFMPPVGLFGGMGGLPPRTFYNGKAIPSRWRSRVKVGDRFLAESAGGGGFGTGSIGSTSPTT
jgi:N-methylhydantoinase B